MNVKVQGGRDFSPRISFSEKDLEGVLPYEDDSVVTMSKKFYRVSLISNILLEERLRECSLQ